MFLFIETAAYCDFVVRMRWLNVCKQNVKSFASHKAHMSVMISISSAVSRALVYSVRPVVHRVVCLFTSQLSQYSLHLPTEGWPG